ncbi:5120_t:CDS:2, partial [Funneliformis mosseae]
STSFRLSKELLNQARNRLLEFQEEKMEDMKPIIIKENVLAKPTSVIAELSESFLLAFVWSMEKNYSLRKDLIVGLNNYCTADLTIRPQELPRSPKGDHIQLWLLKLATARLPLVYMIFRQATFLTNTTIKFILRSNYFSMRQGNARIALPT